MEDTPTPNAMMKGTVIGPVVTPPESKAMARKSFGTKQARTKITRYEAISSPLRGTRNRMRSRATTRKAPTPTATAPISTGPGTLGTCSASTWRSGSEMVTTTPIKKLTATTTQSFRDRVIWTPTRSPMGVMAISAPRVKRPMPAISRTAPIKKASSVSVGTGEMVKHSASTMAVMGSTEARASRTFSPRIVRVFPIFSRQRARRPPCKCIATPHCKMDIYFIISRGDCLFQGKRPNFNILFAKFRRTTLSR